MSNKTETKVDTGADMYGWAQDLFPIHRSITGAGVRETLAYLANLLPGLVVHAVPSGTQAFDWTVPDEWTIRDAYIADDAGHKVIDYNKHNLHVVGYSEPVDTWLSLAELDENLYSLPEQPDAIPYITSYYNRHWGFCLPHHQRKALPSGRYHVVIDSDLKPGVLNYADLILPGKEDSEILLSTYICHPSMANNELSGPVVTAALAQWLQSLQNRRFTYRIVFAPETIGAIVYLSNNSERMMQKTAAGFEISCVGDDRAHSFLPSRKGGTLADRVAEQTLKQHGIDYARYSFLDRGADERQYCSALIDLPEVLVMRTKFWSYPEYHTSLDDLSVISPAGLEGAFNILQSCLQALEANYVYKATMPCEPQLGRRGIKPTLNTKNVVVPRTLMNVLAYADGQTDLLAISEIIGVDMMECAAAAVRLEQEGLLEKVAGE